jgi:two-component system LytT family sensor kinase
MDRIFLDGDHFILVSLLVQVGFMTSLTSMLIATRFYQRLLQQEQLRSSDPYVFGLTFGLCLALAVGLRILIGYSGLDLSVPGTFLAGLFAGPIAGTIVGFLVGGAGLTHGEWLAMPFALLVGITGGLIGRLPDVKRGLWDYSPLVHVNVVRAIRGRSRRDFVPVAISAVCIGFEMARHFLTKEFGVLQLWSFQPEQGYVLALAWVASLVTLGVPLRLWNNTRLEMLLKAQESHAVRAQLDALTHQINPHFLFNTMTSIAAATRRDPELARHLIQKLSQILRRVLQHEQRFVTLAEELEHVDSYLEIEMARFGRQKVRVQKSVEEVVLHTRVPCMLLQPLVENAVNHGIAPLPNGGTITIRAWLDGAHVRIEIADDGAGFDVDRLDLERDSNGSRIARHRGIGLTNVHQRLRITYGTGLKVESRRHEGTRIGFEIPYVPHAAPAEAEAWQTS